MKFERIVAIFVAALLATFIASTDAAAQKAPAKAKPTPRTSPRPLATPPVLSGAEIIRRASDDYVVDAPPVEQPVVDKTAVAPAVSPDAAVWIKDLQDRINKLETSKKETYEDRQKRLLLNLDILTRAEQRTESLRKQIFEITDRENAVKTRLDQIEYEIRPEIIERALQLSGSLRPEEIREARRKSLAAERANLQSLLTNIQNTKATLNLNLEKADDMVVKLRTKLEKDIDDSFLNDKPDQY